MALNLPTAITRFAASVLVSGIKSALPLRSNRAATSSKYSEIKIGSKNIDVRVRLHATRHEPGAAGRRRDTFPATHDSAAGAIRYVHRNVVVRPYRP